MLKIEAFTRWTFKTAVWHLSYIELSATYYFMKRTAIGLALFLFAFFVMPCLIPIPHPVGRFPIERLVKEDGKFITVNGLKVHCKICGSGEPVVMLMHGFGAYSFSFDPIIEELSRHGTVVTFDRPAFGFTERPILDNWTGPNPYTSEFAVSLTIGLMDELGIDRAVLLGHSAGGAIALLTYFAHPDRVKALVLESAAIYEGGPPWLIKALQLLPQFHRLGVLLLRSIAREVAVNAIYSAWYDDSKITPEMIEGYLRPLMAENWDYALLQYALASKELRLYERLGEISVPVLIIAGVEDEIVPLVHSERLAVEIPNSKLVKIERCGHTPHEEMPEEFLKIVVEFLSGHVN